MNIYGYNNIEFSNTGNSLDELISKINDRYIELVKY